MSHFPKTSIENHGYAAIWTGSSLSKLEKDFKKRYLLLDRYNSAIQIPNPTFFVAESKVLLRKAAG